MSADILRSTTVRCLPFDGASWSKLVEAAKKRFTWLDDTPVFVYVETATDCALTNVHLSEAIPRGVLFEGRVFNEAGELRWVAREDPLFDAWLVDEHENEGMPAHVQPRCYFLLGRGAATGGDRFSEGRYPGKIFKYPAIVTDAKPANARAYINVHEYLRVAPTDLEWRAMNDAQVLRALNEPLLIGHRFVGVGC